MLNEEKNIKEKTVEKPKKSSSLTAKKNFILCAGDYDKHSKKHEVNMIIKEGETIDTSSLSPALIENLKTEGVI